MIKDVTYQIWSDDGKNWFVTDKSNVVHKYYAFLNTSRSELNDLIDDTSN